MDSPNAPEGLLLFGPERSAADRVRMVSAVFGRDVAEDVVEPLYRVLSLLGDIGFSFPELRFATMGRGGPCLMEAYGARRLWRATDHIDPGLRNGERDLFGPGFLRDTDSHLEYRRAYIAVRRGDIALLARNNSRWFGRDRLPSPLLFLVGEEARRDLLAVRPDDFADPAFARVEALGSAGRRLLEDMSETLDTVRADLRAFSGWIANPSGGLPHLVRLLARLNDTGGPVPWLCLQDEGGRVLLSRRADRKTVALVERYCAGARQEDGFIADAFVSPPPGARLVLATSEKGDRPLPH